MGITVINQPSPYQSDCTALRNDGARFPKRIAKSTNNIANTRHAPILGIADRDCILNRQCFVRCSFVERSFVRCSFVRLHNVLSDSILSDAFFLSARQFSARHMAQVSYNSLCASWCALLAGFSLIELSLGLTGHKAGFHY